MGLMADALKRNAPVGAKGQALTLCPGRCVSWRAHRQKGARGRPCSFVRSGARLGGRRFAHVRFGVLGVVATGLGARGETESEGKHQCQGAEHD